MRGSHGRFITHLIVVEAAFLLVVSSAALRLIHYNHLLRLLDTYLTARLHASVDGNDEILKAVRGAVRNASRCVPVSVTCFTRAMTATMMLRRRGIPSTLFLGVLTSGKDVQAHAWVQAGHLMITGGVEHERFTAVAWFG
jgi:hypothetical protein